MLNRNLKHEKECNKKKIKLHHFFLPFVLTELVFEKEENYGEDQGKFVPGEEKEDRAPGKFLEHRGTASLSSAQSLF